MEMPSMTKMKRYTLQEREIIVSIFLNNNRSVVLAQREYQCRFPDRVAPTGQTFRRLIARLEQTGTTQDLAGRGRHRTGRSAENIAAVAANFAENEETSTRRRATQLGINRRTLQRILKEVKDLHIFPYKVQTVNQLMPTDQQSRVNYCQSIIDLNTKEHDFVSKVIMSGEAHFHLSGYVNKKNLRFWGTESPSVPHEELSHSLKATVWCGVHAGGVIGPYFFEDDTGNTVPVTGERYRAMIKDYLLPELEARGLVNMWFQQDGTSAHTAWATMDIVNEAFPGRVISRFGDLLWPAKSPDLTITDFFLWGYLKSRVYANNPQTIAALKENIRQECEELSPEILQKVMENVIKRAQMCINTGGSYLMNIISS